MLDLLLAACVGIGLAAATAMRVFLPLFVLGLASRAGLLPLADDFRWVASPAAPGALGVATVLEIGAYYIPWLDHALDAIASPVAVGAGVLATAALLGDADPFLRWALALLAGGGTAATVQATSVAARAASGASTLGLGNPLVSTMEWVGALVTSVASLFVAPLVVLALLAGLVLLLRKRRRRGPGET